MKEGFRKSIGCAVTRVFFGKEIEGEVVRVAQDDKSRVHVLMRTEQGEQHIIHPRSEINVNLRTGEVGIYDFSTLKPGEKLSTRVRGGGFVRYPWRRASRNPFA